MTDQEERSFSNFRDIGYALPNDDEEQRRLDIQHTFVKMVLEGKNYPSGTIQDPQTIVDVACGTGIWAMEMAEEFPNAAVHGVDISDIQPKDAPSNVKWHTLDACKGLPFEDNSVDFIQIRICPNFSDIHAVHRHCKAALRPGGVLFRIEISPDYSLDDTQSKAKDDFFDLRCAGMMAKYHFEELKARGKVGSMIRGMLKELGGFRDVTWMQRDLPIGAWTQDEKLNEIGALLLQNNLNFINSCAAGMKQTLGLDRKMTDELAIKAMEETGQPHRHVYSPYDFIWAFKV
ncbi:S-adenosyl-L-methionine-dependent methyltransferase [Atractiella rhizophila]|nr:S-adenosyl-L-methionine-dependent methyltransferase [Atractiella rhizophila]